MGLSTLGRGCEWIEGVKVASIGWKDASRVRVGLRARVQARVIRVE